MGALRVHSAHPNKDCGNCCCSRDRGTRRRRRNRSAHGPRDDCNVWGQGHFTRVLTEAVSASRGKPWYETACALFCGSSNRIAWHASTGPRARRRWSRPRWRRSAIRARAPARVDGVARAVWGTGAGGGGRGIPRAHGHATRVRRAHSQNVTQKTRHVCCVRARVVFVRVCVLCFSFFTHVPKHPPVRPA